MLLVSKRNPKRQAYITRYNAVLDYYIKEFDFLVNHRHRIDARALKIQGHMQGLKRPDNVTDLEFNQMIIIKAMQNNFKGTHQDLSNIIKIVFEGRAKTTTDFKNKIITIKIDYLTQHENNIIFKYKLLPNVLGWSYSVEELGTKKI